MDNDVLAAKLQLQELQARHQSALDARVAMAVFLGKDNDQQQTPGQTHISSSWLPADDWETNQLREQIDSLTAFITDYEDSIAANSLQEQEQMNNTAYEASFKLADCLAAQESWNKQISDHDAAFAMSLARCNSYDWEDRGDLLQDPLYIPPRPCSPDLNNQLSSTAPLSSSSEVRIRFGTAVVSSSQPNCSQQAQPATSSSSSRPAMQAGPPLYFTSGIAVVTHSSEQSNNNAGTELSDVKGKRPMHPTPAAIHGHAVANNNPSGSTDMAASSSSSNSSQAPQSQCSICYDSFPVSSMVSAVMPQQMASSSAAQGRCGHYFCSGCMRSYVQEQLKSRKYPIHCPMPACQEELGHDDISQLLSKDTKELQIYDQLATEHSIDASLRVYCPYKNCSSLLMKPDEDEEGGGQDGPFECPSCHRIFCLSCGVAGWHMGMTCQQFQALPPELRSVEDAAMLRMAAAQSWKRCPAPGCGHVVERTEGCNHMRCRCGVDFCYACGKQYRNATPTADNVHGTPGCECPLFAVPEEEPEVVPAAPAVVPAAVVLRPARPRPWRGGRQVSRTRCWHSASIYGCPNGPERCWFWHDEDDH